MADQYAVARPNKNILPPDCIQSPRTFYDYEAKYLYEQKHYFSPESGKAGRQVFLQAVCCADWHVSGMTCNSLALAD